MISTASFVEVVDFLILVQRLHEVTLEMIRVELRPLIPPLFKDFGDYPPAEILITLYLLVVDHLVFGWHPHNPELRVVPYLTQLPLLVPVEIIVKSLLLERLKLLELKNLPKKILVRHCSALVRVSLRISHFRLRVQKSVLSVLRKVQKLQFLTFLVEVIHVFHFCHKVMSLCERGANHHVSSLLY